MRLVLSALALAALATPVAASAQIAEDTVTVRVNFADIDLSTPQGRAALEARVEASAREACTLNLNRRYALGRSLVDEKCVADARSAALAEVERLANAAARGGRSVAAN